MQLEEEYDETIYCLILQEVEAKEETLYKSVFINLNT